MKNLFLYLLILFVVGCNSPQPQPTTTSTPSQPAQTQTPAASATPAAAELDLSTPEAGAKAFVEAAQKMDKEMLSKCVSESAAGEFQGLRTGEVPDDELKGLAEMMNGAEVGEAKVEGDKAQVAVKLTERDETFTMMKGESGWTLLDF